MLRHVHCYWKLLVFSCSQHVEAWLGFHDMLLWWSMKDVFWLTFSPGHTDPLDLINQDSNMFLINQELIFDTPDTPRKTNMSPKSDHFSREYIFQPSIFRGHVSFQGSMMSRVGLLFLPPLVSRIYVSYRYTIGTTQWNPQHTWQGVLQKSSTIHSLKWSKESDFLFSAITGHTIWTQSLWADYSDLTRPHPKM